MTDERCFNSIKSLNSPYRLYYIRGAKDVISVLFRIGEHKQCKNFGLNALTFRAKCAKIAAYHQVKRLCDFGLKSRDQQQLTLTI